MRVQNEMALNWFCSLTGLSAAKKSLLAKYIEMVESRGQRTNLISHSDLNRIVTKHVVDSWNFCRIALNWQGARILDIGSGAGFPGMVMAILQPDCQFTLLDAKRIKTLFLKEVIDSLALHNVTVLCQRVEQPSCQSSPLFDVATARAVSTLSQLWGWAEPWLEPQGVLICQKGEVEDEISSDLEMESVLMLHSLSDSRLVILRKGERPGF